MSIRLQCPGCAKALNVREEFAGKRVKCPGCATVIDVPPVARLISDDEPARSSGPPPIPRGERRRIESYDDRDDEPRPRKRMGLEGLSPNYRIQLGRWYELSGPHIGPIVGPAIGYFFVFFAIYIVVMLLHNIIIGFLLDPIVIPALAVGLHIVCQRQLMEKEWSFGTFFHGFRFMWPLAGRAVLLFLVPVVLVLPMVLFMGIFGAIFEGQKPPIVSGLLVVIFLATVCSIIYVSVRLAFFSHFLIIDRGCGPIQALKGSWILSKGHFWGLFGSMILILTCVYFVTFITLGIGMLFALPRAVLMLNAGYLLIAGSEPLPGAGPTAMPAKPRSMAPALIAGGVAVAAVVLIGVVATIGISAMQAERRADDERWRQKEVIRRDRAQADAVKWEARELEQKVDDERRAREIVAFFRDGGYWALTVSERELAMPEAKIDDGPPRPGIGFKDGGPGGGPAPVKVLVLGPRDMLKMPPAMTIGQPFIKKPDMGGLTELLREAHAEWAGRWRAFTMEFENAMARGEVEAALVEVPPPAAGIGEGGGAAGPAPGPMGMAIGGGGGEAARAPLFRLPIGTAIPMDKAKAVTGNRFRDLTVERGWQ